MHGLRFFLLGATEEANAEAARILAETYPGLQIVGRLHGYFGEFEEDETWAEAQMLASTVAPEELTDPDLGVERLLYRLFHERGVRVYDAQPVHDRCSCSREKLKGVLSNFTAEEIDSTIENGEIRVECEFCSTVYKFDPAEFRQPN